MVHLGLLEPLLFLHVYGVAVLVLHVSEADEPLVVDEHRVGQLVAEVVVREGLDA